MLEKLANALAYYEDSSIADKKSFITLGPAVLNNYLKSCISFNEVVPKRHFILFVTHECAQ
jgi:hypothetical protein